MHEFIQYPIPELTDAQLWDLLSKCQEEARRLTGEENPTIYSLRKVLRKKHENATMWKNDEFQVVRYDYGDMIHLSIKHLDKSPIRDWRKFQQIKNMLVGPENEGLELYPAESRLVDSANQYHLWVMADSTIQLPFGFTTKLVHSDSIAGAIQRML